MPVKRLPPSSSTPAVDRPAPRRPGWRPGWRRGRMAACVVAAACVWPAVQAQSLAELYDAARSYDASVLAARAQAESAIYAAAQADALMKPSASLGSSLTYNEVDLPSTQTIFGTQTGRRNSNNTALQAQLQAQQTIYSGTRSPTIAKAYRQLDAANTDLANAEQDLVVRVAQAYFDVLAARDTLGYAKSSKTAITEQLAAAKRNFEVGTTTITDTREAQARYDLAVATEIAAENDLRSKRVALDLLVGRSGVDPKPLAAPVVLPPLAGESVEAWLARAEAEHPSIRKAILGVDVARLDTDIARGTGKPTVQLVGSLVGVRNSETTSNASAGTTASATVGVQLSVPLDIGDQIQNRVKETLVLQDRATNVLDATKRSVALGTRQAYLGVQSGTAQVGALEAAESSTQLALQATQLGYKVGVRVNLDVLNAQTQLFQTQRDLAKARYDVLVGSLKLRQAAGVLQPGDLQAINALLAN